MSVHKRSLQTPISVGETEIRNNPELILSLNEQTTSNMRELEYKLLF